MGKHTSNRTHGQNRLTWLKTPRIASLLLSSENWQELKVVSTERSSFRIAHCYRVSYFYLKRVSSINGKKQVSAAKAKICGLSISIEHPLQISKSGNWQATILLIAGIGIRFPLKLKNELVLGCQFLLYAYSGKPIATTYYRTHFQQEMRIISHECKWAFRHQLFAVGVYLI